MTACPTGIAHTYLAAEALQQAAQARGLTLKVETNGAAGVNDELTDDEIQARRVRDRGGGLLDPAGAVRWQSGWSMPRRGHAVRDADRLLEKGPFPARLPSTAAGTPFAPATGRNWAANTTAT